MNAAKSAPHAGVWAVVLGWNHAEDTVECLASLAASRPTAPTLLYTDNGSRDEEVRKVLDGVPLAKVVRHPANVGVPRGFNGGLSWALRQGAEFVFMANNDTILDPDCIATLLRAATEFPKAGILVPRILYHDAKDVVWSAGSRYRRFPPSIVMRKSTIADDPRYRKGADLEFTTLCTVLVRAEALKAAGLMSPNFLYYCEDYDLALRVREAGWSIRFVPEARSWHKVARVTREGPTSPAFWLTYGRSEAVFRRLHADRWWMTGRAHLAYLLLRSLYEGNMECVKRFLEGHREGMRQELRPPARWDGEGVDTVVAVRV
jgi:GT2 family glycosyltransferase